MAEEEQNFNFSAFNLDFLELTPPKATKTELHQVVRSATPIPSSKSFKPNAFKAKQLAQRIANCDALVSKTHQLDKIQLQLHDFQQSAAEIRKLYETEREQRKELQEKAEQLQHCCDQLNDELAEKMLQHEQLEAQLDETKGPLDYIDLVIKYLKLAQKLDEEHQLCWQQKSLVAELSKYCESRGRNVPVLRSPKKRTRILKHEKAVQCLLLEDTSESELKQLHSQGTQCERVEVRSEGTQHISTTTTRSTSTSCFIKQRSVGTCFPEPTVLPPLTEMLNDILQWNNVSPLSPIADLPDIAPHPTPIEASMEPERKSVACKSVGTCTVLCNVRRQIDFLPTLPKLKRSQSRSPLQFTYDNVKHEAFSTPSSSPPPIAPGHVAISTNSSVNAQKGLSMLPHLSEMPPDMFTTIWQMAGQMFMGLLYAPTGNGPCISLTGENATLKHQEFHNWLFSLYESMQQKPQENWPNAEGRGRSPSPVNITPNAPSDILRPKAKREGLDRISNVKFEGVLSDHTTDDIAVTNIENSFEQTEAQTSSNVLQISAFKEPQKIQMKTMRRNKVQPEKTLEHRKRKLHEKSNLTGCICDKGYDSLNLKHKFDTQKLSLVNITNERDGHNEDIKTAVDFCVELCPVSKTSDGLQKSHSADIIVSKEYIKEVFVNDDFFKNMSNSREHIISEEKKPEEAEQFNPNHIEFNNSTTIEIDRINLSPNMNELQSIVLDYNLFGSDSDSENECNTNVDRVEYKQLNMAHDTNESEESDCDLPLIIDENCSDNEKRSTPGLCFDSNARTFFVNNSDTVYNASEAQSNLECSTNSESNTNISAFIDSEILNDILNSDPTNGAVNDILSGALPDVNDEKSPVRHGRKRKLSKRSPLRYNYSTRLKAKQSKLNSPQCNDSAEDIQHNECSKGTNVPTELNLIQSESTQDHDNKENFEDRLIWKNKGIRIDDSIDQMGLTTNINKNSAENCALDIQRSITKFSKLHDSLDEEATQNSNQSNHYANSCSNMLGESYDSPASPVLISSESQPIIVPCKSIPLELDPEYYQYKDKFFMERLINCYSASEYKIVAGSSSAREQQQALVIESQLMTQLEEYIRASHENVDLEAAKLAQTLHKLSKKCDIIADAIVNQIKDAPRPHEELACPIDKVPPRYIGSHIRLISVLLRHLQDVRSSCVGAVLNKIENTLFQCQKVDKISLNTALNQIQLYLLTIPIHYSTVEENPVRLLVAKILYYYNKRAATMVYEVLCHYPTTLPHREESSYDRSDALITVIQHILMCTNYDMSRTDLRTKELLSMLRFQYHFQPFKPSANEVLSNLVAKLKAGKLINLKYAFAIFCKRQQPGKVIVDVLQKELIPLVDEYYHMMQQTCDYDERIAALLDSISTIVKPFPLDTDVSMYLSIFHRFLNAVERPVIQEAAVLAILRMQRFGYIRCFHALSNFAPSYTLQPLTKNVLKTFIHRKSLKVWKCLLQQTARY